MLEYNDRINSKQELKDWLSYELPRYSGNGAGGGTENCISNYRK